MGPDYEKLGLRVGFEIHQELNTHKLFCNCPSRLRDEEPLLKVKRRLTTLRRQIYHIQHSGMTWNGLVPSNSD